jgi:hypothetical protein
VAFNTMGSRLSGLDAHLEVLARAADAVGLT